MHDIVLLHPPAILLPEPYPVFPMPWCPEFIGSTDDLDHFPTPERFTARNFFPIHASCQLSFFRDLLDVLDCMNRVYASCGLYSEAWTQRARRYNDLLVQFWEPYLRWEAIESADEKRSAFVRLGQELMEQYYE